MSRKDRKLRFEQGWNCFNSLRPTNNIYKGSRGVEPGAAFNNSKRWSKQDLIWETLNLLLTFGLSVLSPDFLLLVRTASFRRIFLSFLFKVGVRFTQRYHENTKISGRSFSVEFEIIDNQPKEVKGNIYNIKVSIGNATRRLRNNNSSKSDDNKD